MKKIIYINLFLSILLMTGCKKYLEAKPDKKLTVPTTLADLQALMDNYTKLNTREPIAGEVSSDDYYVTTPDWMSLASAEYKRMYTWEKDFLFTNTGNSWANLSEVIYFSNSVLESLEGIDGIRTTEYSNIKGQALFNRAKAFLQASYIWTLAYDPITSNTDLGLPLRLNSDFNQPSKRTSVKLTYDQIISDLTKAIPLLNMKPLHVMRASKPAAYALLARTYLSMREYPLAALCADSCLQLSNALIDYNKLDSNATNPIKRFNEEVVMETMIPGDQILNPTRAKITRSLYDLYTVNDLRKVMFFRKSGTDILFKGSYEGNTALFGGMAVDEMYLIRAEGNARQGKVSEAMNDLNTLLIKRFKNGKFIPLIANSSDEALKMVLLERRKELLMRGIRWSDIKRLNKEGAEIFMRREVNGKNYELKPNDLRYALPLPEYLIELTGMPQNPR